MKLNIKQVYLRRNLRNRSPATYHAVQKNGVGSDVNAVVKLAPILKKHSDLRRGILKHEREEIYGWAKGQTGNHRRANRSEPSLTKKLGGTKGFWNEIDRRNKRK